MFGLANCFENGCKYYFDVEAFFFDEPEEIKKEENAACKIELIELTGLSDSESNDNDEPLEKSTTVPKNRLRKLELQTIAQTLSDISEGMVKYDINDLILMADAERKAEPINQNGTSGKPDEENTAQRPNSKPGARKYNQVSQTQGQGWTLVEILTFVCKGHKKYHLVDLALLITTLAKTTPDNYPKIFDELGERYSKEGKDYGITGSRWKRLWERYRDTLDKCVSELRRGDKSLDGILSNKSKRNDTDSPLPPAASDTESETKFESRK
ncbi:hypothetical protein FS837_003991 [Tulasnella sp. UAMH 9824]|nr:hypothetical protein FS837_003991 [Tulasnella sp. UAMH 9824]